MKLKDTIEIRIGELQALLDIYEDFEEFNQKIKEFFLKIGQAKGTQQLAKITKQELCLNPIVNRFYQENKRVIDKINQHFYISNFLLMNYDQEGNLFPTSGLPTFFKYLHQHENEFQKIRTNLKKLQNLQMDKIVWNEEFDFEKEEYQLASWGLNYRNFYLANIEIIPNHESQIIKYKTTSSPYKIELSPGISRTEYSIYGRKIYLNTLLFDPALLPDTITKQEIYDSIVEKRKAQESSCILLKNAVNLKVGILDCRTSIQALEKIIEKLDSVKTKEELKEAFKELQRCLNQVEEISKLYDQAISKKEENLTESLIEKEKELYLKRRGLIGIDET